jgi:hypothetical protein
MLQPFSGRSGNIDKGASKFILPFQQPHGWVASDGLMRGACSRCFDA